MNVKALDNSIAGLTATPRPGLGHALADADRFARLLRAGGGVKPSPQSAAPPTGDLDTTDANASDANASDAKSTDAAKAAESAKAAKAYKAAQQLVAITFVQPILAEARKDPMRSEMFHGGMAEDMFGAQLDQILAERITKTARLPIVDAVYRRAMQQAGGADAALPPGSPAAAESTPHVVNIHG